MRFSLTSLLRLFVLSSLGLSAVAIGAGRIAPTPRNLRNTSVVRHVSLNAFFFPGEITSSRWLDTSSGRVVQLKLPAGDVLDYASCSPWQDETGQSQVIGRWSQSSGQHAKSMKSAFGMARVRFPSGEVLDQFETEVFPIGVPCWLEGRKVQVVFAAADGALYEMSFDEPDGDRQPHELRWDVPKPGIGKIFISDTSWIENTPHRKILAVAMRVTRKVEDRSRFSPLQLFWLKISDDGRTVVDLGRLSPEPSMSEGETEDRCPVIHASADGQKTLAYLRRTVGKKWGLFVTELNHKGESATPTVSREGRLLATPCQPMTPAFSADGRWISTLRGENPATRELVRLSLEPEHEGIAAVDRIVTDL